MASVKSNILFCPSTSVLCAGPIILRWSEFTSKFKKKIVHVSRPPFFLLVYFHSEEKMFFMCNVCPLSKEPPKTWHNLGRSCQSVHKKLLLLIFFQYVVIECILIDYTFFKINSFLNAISQNVSFSNNSHLKFKNFIFTISKFNSIKHLSFKMCSNSCTLFLSFFYNFYFNSNLQVSWSLGISDRIFILLKVRKKVAQPCSARTSIGLRPRASHRPCYNFLIISGIF